MLECKPVDTPMGPNLKLIPNQGEPYPNPGRHRRLVGKLNCLTMTRPDIAFQISAISQFLNSSCESLKCYCLDPKIYPRINGLVYTDRGHKNILGY